MLITIIVAYIDCLLLVHCAEVNMIAASFGTGILSMPWSTAGASLIPALVVVFLVTVLMVLKKYLNETNCISADNPTLYSFGRFVADLLGGT